MKDLIVYVHFQSKTPPGLRGFRCPLVLELNNAHCQGKTSRFLTSNTSPFSFVVSSKESPDSFAFYIVLLCILECLELLAFRSPRKQGRFPFDQIFRFLIPGIPCDEWNSIFRFVGLTNPRSSGFKFRAKIRHQTEDSFTFVYLLWGCSTTLKLKLTMY